MLTYSAEGNSIAELNSNNWALGNKLEARMGWGSIAGCLCGGEEKSVHAMVVAVREAHALVRNYADTPCDDGNGICIRDTSHDVDASWMVSPSENICLLNSGERS
jgi:hypothetical protein